MVDSSASELAPVPSALVEARRVDLARAKAVARWTDQRFLDPLLGLVLPGLGDVLGMAAGLYIVRIAVRHGVPRRTVRRMLFNLGIDFLGGVVPIVGDIFDFLNRANVRNARLLEQHLGAVDGASAIDSSGHRDLVDG